MDNNNNNNNNKHISIVPWGPKIQRRLQQHRRTKPVWRDGFSSGA